MDIVVIGAGPAGLSAAISSANALQEKNIDGIITLLEKKPRPGRKLLLSGAGQCNITRDEDVEEILDGYGNILQGRFLKKALYSYSPIDLIKFFKERGVSFSINPDGKIFPSSGKARDILNPLLKELQTLGIALELECEIQKIEKKEESFILTNNKGEEVSSSMVILACGGKSYPSTGSNGGGYALAAGLGHSLIDPHPGLTNIKVTHPLLNGLAGLSFKDVELIIPRKGDKKVVATGDLVITHEGFSGPLILDNSRNMAAGNNFFLNFIGDAESVLINITEKIKDEPKKKFINIVSELSLPKRLLTSALEYLSISADIKSAEIGKKQILKLINFFARCEFIIDDLGGWNTAMATAGGISLREINPSTMESKITPGLFFAGEIIDVDGNTGGYNIQAAFSTGHCAGVSAAVGMSGKL